jgi:hypothetical protein
MPLGVGFVNSVAADFQGNLETVAFPACRRAPVGAERFWRVLEGFR